MINILVHGLGQDETSWNEVKNQLNSNGIKVETPNLFSIVKNYQVNYENMYKTFADYCNSFNRISRKGKFTHTYRDTIWNTKDDIYDTKYYLQIYA